MRILKYECDCGNTAEIENNKNYFYDCVNCSLCGRAMFKNFVIKNKTLEDKFKEYFIKEDGFLPIDVWKDLSKIAEEHCSGGNSL